jgi:hypothetical protein
MERRTDQGPNMGLYANLLMAASQNQPQGQVRAGGWGTLGDTMGEHPGSPNTPGGYSPAQLAQSAQDEYMRTSGQRPTTGMLGGSTGQPQTSGGMSWGDQVDAGLQSNAWTAPTAAGLGDFEGGGSYAPQQSAPSDYSGLSAFYGYDE